MIIKDYKYENSTDGIHYIIDVDGREFAMEHIKISYGSAQNDIDDFLVSVKSTIFKKLRCLENLLIFKEICLCMELILN